MFTRTLIGSSLAVAFALTVTGTAFARRPPALAQRQAATESVLSTCAGAGTQGYRGNLARSEARASQAPKLQAMGDHVVIVCAGGKVHAPGGYRDLDRRFKAQPAQVQIAKASCEVAQQ
jgi:hypothetical protein